jgi:hypothetical protein
MTTPLIAPLTRTGLSPKSLAARANPELTLVGLVGQDLRLVARQRPRSRNVAPGSKLYTDAHGSYRHLNGEYLHEYVNHRAG